MVLPTGADRLPDGFMWGTTASSTQTEGAAPGSDWARWERLGRAPASGAGNRFSTRYAEDFAHFAELGLTHHRLSLEWARLEPRQGSHDGAAVEHYREMLRAAAENGVSVWVCLHHLSSPGWFADDLGGFVDDHSRSLHWARHVDFVAETFGDLVHGWIPIGEPVRAATGGFLDATLPPGRSGAEQFIGAMRGLHLANVDAARLLHGNGAPVATAMDLCPVVARATGADPLARDAARTQASVSDQVTWGWTRMLREGVLELPGIADIEIPVAVGAFDLVGFSHFHSATIDEHGATGPFPVDGEVGPMGYVPSADGLGECLERLADELPGRPLLITGFGVGTRSSTSRSEDATRDDQRRELLERAFEITTAKIASGIDVRGFFHTTGVDGYEWLHGFDVSFGLLDIERNRRGSAELVAAWARP